MDETRSEPREYESTALKSLRLAVATFACVLLVAGLTTPEHGTGNHGTASASEAMTSIQVRAAQAFGRLPLAFEPNLGQGDSGARFLSHGLRSAVSLTSSGALLSVEGLNPVIGASPSLAATERQHGAAAVLGIRFIGANPSPQVVGTGRLGAVSNYFIGDVRSRWLRGVPTYDRVTYRDLYPGIDVTFYGNQSGRLEYDFTVAPGADPSAIRLAFDGPDAIKVGASGELVLPLDGERIVQPKPRTYQVMGSSKQPVAGSYVVDGKQIRFHVGAFDATRPLVIDPEIEYSTYLGGSGDDLGEVHPAVDDSGHAYICGETTSTDFPITGGAHQTQNNGGFDAFVTEFNADGTGLVYSTYLGGTGDFDIANACALDSAGNLYLAGPTNSGDFPTTPGAFQDSFHGGNGAIWGTPTDGFVAKLNPEGTDLLYSTYVGGSGDDDLITLKADPLGEVFAAGDTASTDFPVTPGAFQTSNAGGVGHFPCPGSGGSCDAVVIKLNAAGSALVYSTYLGGKADDCCQPGLAIDAQGNAYVVGATASKDFPTTPGAYQPLFAGGLTDPSSRSSIPQGRPWSTQLFWEATATRSSTMASLSTPPGTSTWLA
jgi:Beta-propeller repeat